MTNNSNAAANSEFLLELFSEEIPANMQKSAEEAYTKIFSAYLQKHEISFEQIRVYIGPRRIAISATGLPSKMPAKNIEQKGPRVDAPAKAIEGFCKSNSVKVEDLETREIKGQECYFLVKKIAEKNVSDLLAETLAEPIAEYVWPKSMYWGSYKIKWVRPLHNILCILDGMIVPLKYGHLTANDQTYGHRFMAPDAIKIANIDEYIQKLKDAFVIVDRKERLDIISTQIQESLTKKTLNLKEDFALLDEVAGLAEFPKVLVGKIDDKFLDVPSEILITSMRSHQKYFSTFDSSGKFAPYFVFVTNILSSDEAVVISGNEKVLSARLSDALYFYNQDLKISLEARATRLDKVIFHEKLGSLGDKSRRLAKICSHIAPEDNDSQIAAAICKSDIVSEVVGEFAGLQGIMGHYYALAEGKNTRIAQSIRDHYKPAGANDVVPEKDSSTLALADKIDSLVGLMLSGERPTGSKDPYALRRIALGIIRIIIEHGLRINLVDLINYSISCFDMKDGEHQATADEILLFIEERTKYYFRDTNSQACVDATLDILSDAYINQFKAKLVALEEFMQGAKSGELLNSYKRVSNIISKGKNVHSNDGTAVKEELFTTEYETDLNTYTDKVISSVKEAIEAENYSHALSALTDLADPLHHFFENVLVNDEDKQVAENRIAILHRVSYAFDLIAKFDKL